MTKRLELLLGQYMTEQPNSENPFNFSRVYSEDQIEIMLIEAKNRLIEFKLFCEKSTGNPIPDLIIPFVAGRPLPSFDLPLKDYSFE